MITLLIPTKNRSEFLSKTLRYYADNDYNGLIFIGDSSDSSHVEKIKETIQKLPGKVNIKYKWYPQELNFTKCINQMLQDVASPYASFIGDDDFLVPKSIEICVEFLNANREYIGAHGVGARILVERHRTRLKINAISDYRLSPREEGTAAERLLNHMSNISNMLFSVYRTDILKSMFENTELPDHSLAGDLLPGCLAVVKGKIKKLDCFHMVHLVHEGQNKAYQDIYDWLTGPNWFPSYQMFKQILSDELSKRDAITLDESHFIVKKAFWSYLKYKLNNHYKSVYGKSGFKHNLMKSMPFSKRLLNKARQIRYKIFPSNEVNMHTLLNSRSPYHNDFMPIYHAVADELYK